MSDPDTTARNSSALAYRAGWKRFEDLGPVELYDLLRLRCDVFVVEQRCAYPDIDGRDPEALHLLAWLGSDEALAGCLRVFAPGLDGPHAQIGRVATARTARGRGLGRAMMLDALSFIDRRFSGATTEIGAQVAAERFYADLGFRRASEDYDEDGVAHCRMLRSGSHCG